jgi:hypothetical protein
MITDLKNENSSYLIISSKRLNEVVSILYAKEYKILPISEYFNGNFEESIIAWGVDNESLRRDSIFILNELHEESAIIKYSGDGIAKKVNFNGSEHPLDIILFNTDSNYKSYIHNGVSFSFKESKRYWVPKNMNDLKVGMVVEYMNNNKWHEKMVQNPQDEWEKLYKLLIKYDKLRVSA